MESQDFKQQNFQSATENRRLVLGGSKTSLSMANNTVHDENQLLLVAQWLDYISEQELITFTSKYDIIIQVGGQNDRKKQVLINRKDIDTYLEAKYGTTKVTARPGAVSIQDLASIIIEYGYINLLTGSWPFGPKRIAFDTDEFIWLTSIIGDFRHDARLNQFEINLYNGEHIQTIRLPCERLPLTADKRMVAEYLFHNGHVRYDINTGNYFYRYVDPGISEHNDQRERLISHIRQVYIDEEYKQIKLEFLHEPTNRLILPVHWYSQVLAHRCDLAYIVDMLLANGGKIDRDRFTFMNRNYSLQIPRVTTSATLRLPSANDFQLILLSQKAKSNLIHRYVELIIEQDGVQQDDTNRLLVLKNPTDGRLLYFTREHSALVRQNDFHREDVIQLLTIYGEIKRDKFDRWLLFYYDQYVQLPPSLIPA
jgi:hypothetical protein